MEPEQGQQVMKMKKRETLGINKERDNSRLLTANLKFCQTDVCSIDMIVI